MRSFASEDPWIDPTELALANERHDTQPHTVPMENRIRFKTMRLGENIVGELLTDKKISRYEKKGYYSPGISAGPERFSGQKEDSPNGQL